jgi:hypothetical protein
MKILIGGLFLAALLSGATSAHAQICGNGVCSAGESTASCPDDCYCGDGSCGLGESTTSCPDDCYCGNARCDSGENGSTCGQECCDFNTSCTQTKDNAGVYLCRRWSINNGTTWTGYGWQSMSSYNAQYCSQQSQVCVVQSNCHNTYAICVHPTWGSGRFEILPTASCP